MDTITNRHEGKRFYICGSSPYATVLPTSLMDGGIKIVINTAYDYCPQADYWIAYDAHVFSTEPWFYEYAQRVHCPKFLRYDPCETHKYENDPTLGDLTWYRDKVERHSGINREWDGGLVHFGTTATDAVHLAYIMGASEIVLWGVDIQGNSRFDGSQYPPTQLDPDDYWARFRSRFNAYLHRYDVPIFRINPYAKLDIPLITVRELAHGKAHTAG